MNLFGELHHEQDGLSAARLPRRVPGEGLAMTSVPVTNNAECLYIDEFYEGAR